MFPAGTSSARRRSLRSGCRKKNARMKTGSGSIFSSGSIFLSYSTPMLSSALIQKNRVKTPRTVLMEMYWAASS